MLRLALDAYRRTGADPPFADPALAHGTALEGYYWRVVDATAGLVLVVLCGVCRDARGSWAVVAVAAHPGGFTRHAVVAPAGAEPDFFGAWAGDVLRGSAEALSVRLGPDARVDLRLRCPLPWPGRVFGALGPAQLVPGLAQYWHPVVLVAEAEGQASLGGTELRFEGATGYAEKNWGPGFPGHWWWGHAGAFPDGDATAAFAGGPLGVAGRELLATAVVVRLGTQVLPFVPPRAIASAAATTRAWRIRARSPRHAIEIEGAPSGSPPHLLPVPDFSARRVDMRSTHHLAGRLRLRVRRGRRTLYEGESLLAGLELGLPASRFSAPPRGGPRR